MISFSGICKWNYAQNQTRLVSAHEDQIHGHELSYDNSDYFPVFLFPMPHFVCLVTVCLCTFFIFFFYSSFTFHILCDVQVFIYLSLLHFLQGWKHWKPLPFRTYKALCCFWYSVSTYVNFTTANNNPSPSSSSSFSSFCILK